MSTLIVALVVGLLVAGIFASVLPVIPGSLVTAAGIVLYWVGIGELPTLVLAALLGIVILVAILDQLATLLTTKAGGGSWISGAIGTAIGLVLAIVSGPVGLVVGIFGTIVLAELLDGKSAKIAIKAGAYGTIGVLASKAMQVVVSVIALVVVVGFGIL